jgi:hypothetical protein
MKTWNIIPKNITVAGETQSVVTLGENGRGRQIKQVPCPASFEFLEPTAQNPNSSIKTRVKLLSSASEKGWVARVSTESSYIRGANGYVSTTPEFAKEIRVVALGNGAFGDAGRTGTWDDIIICTEMDNFWLRVKPSRGSAYLLIFKEGKVFKTSYAEAEILDIDLGESSETNKGNCVRLG